MTEAYREFYKGRRVMVTGGLGFSEPIRHRDLAALLIRTAGTGRVQYVESPPEEKRIDIGSFYCDSTRFREPVGWTPQVSLCNGLRRTLEYYRAHMPEYAEYVGEPRLEPR